MELTILFPTLLAKKHQPVPQTVILSRDTVIHRQFKLVASAFVAGTFR